MDNKKDQSEQQEHPEFDYTLKDETSGVAAQEQPKAVKEDKKISQSDYLNTMEPLVVVDKSRNKESHLISSTLNDFGDLLESARRINTNMFQGVWDLCYLHPDTNKPVYIDEDRQIGDIVSKGINTFYWKYKRPAYKWAAKSDYVNKKYKEEAKDWASNPKKRVEPIEQPKKAKAKKQNTKKRTGGNLQTIEYGYMGKRMMAYAIDMVFLVVLSGIFGFEGFSFLAMWMYFALLESSDFQATFGKMMMGLKVTDLSGRKLSVWQATKRYGVKAVMLTFSAFFAFFTEKRQALHDIVAGSVVTEVKPHASPKAPVIKQRFTNKYPNRTYYIKINKR